MPPTDTNSSILPPQQMNAMRTCGGVPFRLLSQDSKVSAAQLCEYELGRINLRDDQLLACKRVLLRAVREREKQIAALLS